MGSRRSRGEKYRGRGSGSREMLWGLVVLRTVVGLVFLVHGASKLLLGGLAETTATITAAGLPLPGLLAGAVGLLELVGGILLTLGILVRPTATLLAVEMVAVILIVHLRNGFFVSDGGYEYPLVMLASLVALSLAGRVRP